MKTLTAIFFLCAISIAILYSQETKKEEKKEISLSKDLMPIINKRCIKCHQPDSDGDNGYMMDTYENIVKGGKYKKAVVVGKSEESYLITKLLPNPPKGKQMPLFSKKKLTEDEVNLFKQWINEGAKDN